MRLAASYDRIHGAGAELAAVSVDDDVRQSGMVKRSGLTHTAMISDRGGHTYLQPLGLFDPNERDGIALPGMLIIDPDGAKVYRYQGRDFADRTNDDDLFDALDLPPVGPPPWAPTADVPDDLRGFFRPSDLGAYYRGNMFGAIAIGGRLTDDESRGIAKEHRDMARSTFDAWKVWSKHL